MSYTTTQRFKAGDAVPRWMLIPSRGDSLIFAQHCDVVYHRAERHADLHPVIHPALRPNFRAGAFFSVIAAKRSLSEQITIHGTRQCQSFRVVEEPLRGFEESGISLFGEMVTP